VGEEVECVNARGGEVGIGRVNDCGIGWSTAGATADELGDVDSPQKMQMLAHCLVQSLILMLQS